MSWETSNTTDSWDFSPMSSSLPAITSKDEDEWGSGGDFVNTYDQGDNPAGFDFGTSNDPEPVQDDSCRRCRKPGHFAKNCPEPSVCFNCGEAGHNKSECTNPKKFRGSCRHCGEEGHPASECPSKPKRACFNCGEEGHSKAECSNPKVYKGPCKHCLEEGHASAECPEKPEMLCYNCNQPGHASKECTEPRVFKGVCRVCNTQGHPASECPDRGPLVCRNCGQEGHAAASCTAARKIHNVAEDDPIVPPEESWESMIKADHEEDLEEFRKHLMAYSRACPEVTFKELEEAFRIDNFKVHLIAMETQPIGNKTLVNLQGKQDLKYVVKLQLGPKPKRSGLIGALIAQTPEENLQRLDEAGFVMDGNKPYCARCKQVGHIVKTCPEEKPEQGEKRNENSIRERPAAVSAGPWVTIY